MLKTSTQVSKIRIDFTNSSSADRKFSKTHLSKTVELGEFILGSPDIFNQRTKGFLSFLSSLAK